MPALLRPLEAFGNAYGDAIGELIFDGFVILVMIVAVAAFGMRSVRNWKNPVFWVSLVVLTGGAANFLKGPVQDFRTDLFLAEDPGYAEAALPFTGRSIYIERPCLVAQAAVGEIGNSLMGDCGVPLAAWLREGRLDFVEVGTDPVRRFRLRDGDPACHEPDNPWVPSGFLISAAYGICVLAEDVTEVSADHRIVYATENLPTKDWWYVRITLVEVSTGQIIDRFDSWSGATPYGGATPPPEARRPMGPLGDLLGMAAHPPDDTEAAIDAHLLSLRPPDEAMLVAAMGGPFQRYRVAAIWFACRDAVRPRLSAATVAALYDGSKTLFERAPSWRYPDDCPPFARQGLAGPDRPAPPLPPLAPSLMEPR
ncbi:hypothetical protein [Jannaschia pohangensis]|uniref:Uncharacterized protein n=1 Tax=Jannaschia pohangensis TaxID=390807 RepID=A0A1I3QAD3_9RHOB|nr:hypothetical protein [Jannaschia pohangensis]SFJ30281.1 hypothetical protein SAMN04488095_2457 [Jannaschia pohangensis]